MTDPTYTTKIYETDGGDTVVVAAGGVVNFDAGTGLQIAGTDRTAGIAAAAQSTGTAKAGKHVATAGEAGAGTLAIPAGLTAVDSLIVQIVRGGKVATSDAAVSFAAGNITVANGVTYAVTANDVINWIAVGTV